MIPAAIQRARVFLQMCRTIRVIAVVTAAVVTAAVVTAAVVMIAIMTTARPRVQEALPRTVAMLT